MGITKPTVLTARVNVDGHDIVFNNSWSVLPLKSKATLDVDGVEVASSDKLLHVDPHVPVFKLENVNSVLKSIEVFVIGVVRLKAAIKVNGEVVYKDELDTLDKIQAEVFEN